MYVNESVPLKCALGVYVNAPSAFSVSTPFVGDVCTATLRESASTSLSFARTPGLVTTSGLSSSTV